MKITLDLDTNVITVPKNFFTKIEKENDVIAKHGGKPIPPVERVKNAFNAAMENTDKFLQIKA